jgi:hypothetical protein
VLEDFEEFIKEFQACFGDTDSVRTAINKIRRSPQGDRSASTYATDFRLLACDIPWDKQALIDQFHQGQRNHVKDLLLTFHEDPKSLTEAISWAMRCDNLLSDAEKQCRWANRLCLYCGGPGHIPLNCPHKPRRKVNQVSAHDH